MVVWLGGSRGEGEDGGRNWGAISSLGGGLRGRRGAFHCPQTTGWKWQVGSLELGGERSVLGAFQHVTRVITAALRGGGRLTSQTALPSESMFSLSWLLNYQLPYSGSVSFFRKFCEWEEPAWWLIILYSPWELLVNMSAWFPIAGFRRIREWLELHSLEANDGTPLRNLVLVCTAACICIWPW